MSDKSQTTTTTTKKSRVTLLNLICYVAVVCIGISLLLSKVGLGGKVSSALSYIAQIISYLILISISCIYLIRRRNIWLWIVWAVSVALIILGLCL